MSFCCVCLISLENISSSCRNLGDSRPEIRKYLKCLNLLYFMARGERNDVVTF